MLVTGGPWMRPSEPASTKRRIASEIFGKSGW